MMVNVAFQQSRLSETFQNSFRLYDESKTTWQTKVLWKKSSWIRTRLQWTPMEDVLTPQDHLHMEDEDSAVRKTFTTKHSSPKWAASHLMGVISIKSWTTPLTPPRGCDPDSALWSAALSWEKKEACSYGNRKSVKWRQTRGLWTSSYARTKKHNLLSQIRQCGNFVDSLNAKGS